MRLASFPTPVEGEAFDSVVARYWRRAAGSSTAKAAAAGLNGHSPLTIAPRKPSAVAAAMPTGHPWCDDPAEILLRHTYVPLTLHFADAGRRQERLRLLLSDECDNSTAVAGAIVKGHNFKQRSPKFCPECDAEDIARRGFPVFYTAHQPPAVFFCHKHKVALDTGCRRCNPPLAGANPLRQIKSLCQCPKPERAPLLGGSISDKEKNSWIWLAEQVRSVLDGEVKQLQSPSHAVRSGLVAAGYSSSGGIADKMIFRNLVERFGETFLSHEHVSLFGDSGKHGHARWISRTLATDRLSEKTPSFVRMILLQSLIPPSLLSDPQLTYTASPRLDKEAEAPSAPAKKRAGLTNENISAALAACDGVHTDAARLLGVQKIELILECERRGIRIPLRWFYLTHYKSRTERCKRDFQAGRSLDEVCEMVGIGPLHALMIQMDCPRVPPAGSMFLDDQLRPSYRERLLKHLQKCPNTTRRQVRDWNHVVYSWLRHYDSDWLDETVPEKTYKHPTSQGVHHESLWRERDAAALARVSELIRVELSGEPHPAKLSRTRLLREAQVSRSHRHRRSVLPLTFAAIDAVNETKDMLHRRKLRWALDRLGEAGPLNVRLISLKAILTPPQVLHHALYVAELADELGLRINSSSSLGAAIHKKRLELQSTDVDRGLGPTPG